MANAGSRWCLDGLVSCGNYPRFNQVQLFAWPTFMALESLSAGDVGRMARRVQDIADWLRDLQRDMLDIDLTSVPLNTGNFDLYVGYVEDWKKSAEAKKSKVFRETERKREKERKLREKAKADQEAARKLKKTG
jgi:hypothetical protein